MGTSSVVRYLEHTPLNASLIYVRAQSARRQLSRSVGVAQSSRVRLGGVFVHSRLSQTGDVRFIAPDAAGGGLHPGQHLRRIPAAWPSRKSTVHEYRRGVAGGMS